MMPQMSKISKLIFLAYCSKTSKPILLCFLLLRPCPPNQSTQDEFIGDILSINIIRFHCVERMTNNIANRAKFSIF